MRYVFLGRTGLRISQLCLGMVDFGTRVSPDVSRLIWNRSIDAGINLFDTADAAPESEALLGVFAHEKRQALVISTKVFRQTGPGVNDAGLSRKHIVQACEASLRRLKTDYIDVYLAHSDDFLTPIEETLSAFDQLVRQGKVLYVGASNYTAWRLNEALWIALIRNCASYCCIQALYNLRDRDIEIDLLPMCSQKGIGVLAWSPLARGALTERVSDLQQGAWSPDAVEPGVLSALAEVAAQLGRPRSQVAMRWILNRSGISAIVFGASSPIQLEQNLGASDLQLSPAQMTLLDAATAPRMPYPASIEPFARSLRSSE